MSAMPTFIDCIVIYLVSIRIFLSMMYNFGLCQKEINYKKNYFRDQTIIDDKDVALPMITPYDVESNLSTITFTPADIESILK